MSSPRLIVVTSSWPGAERGREAAGAFVRDYCHYMQSRVRVTVIAPAVGGICSDEMEVHGFWAPEGRALSTLSFSSPADIFIMLRVMVSGLWATFVATCQYRKEPTQILALWLVPCGLWAWLAATIFGVRYAVWALGSDIWNYKDNVVLRPLLRLCARDASHCFADGFGLCDEVRVMTGRECMFLPSARRLPPAAGRKRHDDNAGRVLHFLGRWHPNKGIDRLLQALQMLEDQDWARIAGVVIAGGGPLEAEVKAAVDRLQQMNRPVTLRGYLGAKQAADFIAAADYLLLPSRIESIPVILSDAVHCNTPPVMTPVGDLPHLFMDYGFGVLARSTTPTDIAAAIREALVDSPTNRLGDCTGLGELLSLESSCQHLLQVLNPGFR